jgi:PAS domain S-box-containing protein
VTARRRTLEALLETENKFSRMFQLSPECIVLFDLASYRVHEVNAATEKILGYSREELVGRSIPEIGFWVDVSDWSTLLGLLASRGEVLNRGARMRRRDARVIHMEISARQFELEGRNCVVAILEDVSERMRLADEKQRLEDQLRQSQKLEALGTLAGGIAHDFNNALTIILGNTQLAELDSQLAAQTREHLRSVMMAGGRARDLVAQILTFSRRRDQRYAPVATAPVLAECVRMLRPTIPANIELQHTELAPEAVVMGDASQLHQVIINLCTNAVHAMRPGGGRLRLEHSIVGVQSELHPQYSDLRSGPYLRIEVRDTGCGMSEAVLRRMFEPFFTTKAQGEGTGLGLAVVHGIVRGHHGFIDVSSVPGEGSSFRVYLPLAAETGEAAVANVVATAPARGNGEAILVLDDEYAVLDMLEKLLRHLNYQPICFSNPGAAVDAFNLRPGHYQLVLSDFKMPQRTGLEVSRQLKGLDPARFILMTGFLDSATQEDARELGISRVLEKPLELSVLAEALQTSLAQVKGRSR